jgi:spore germination protein GerM
MSARTNHQVVSKSISTIALLGSVLLAGCSASTESNPRPLDERFHITIESKNAPAIQSATEAVIIYLIQGPDLIRRTRLTSPPLTPESLLGIVASGPTAGERDAGIRSALGSIPLVVNSLTMTDRSMVLDLAIGFAELPGEEQTLLIGQIVLSLFENFPVTTIEVTLAGAPTSVLGPGGEVIERVILPSDFRPLVVNLR